MRNISFQVDDARCEQVEALAKASHKSRAEIMREAIDAKLAYENYKQEAIADGMRALKAGEVVSHASVVERMQRLKEKL